MLTYYDSKNQSYVFTNRIGSGGEGTVYSCPNDEKTVAKIYHEPISDEKAEKLRWMAANSNEQLLKVAAWIVDTLHDAPGGKVVGFLMPNVKAKEIHELYSLKSRRVYFPEATWQFLIYAATNLARAFHNLHKNEHVMGDVNHGNCVVLADATVKLIDCDSYSIKLENRRYPCEVGVASHLAPELQGVNLRGVERLEKHDNFGLAVIVFQLLFLGRHPFAGNYAGGEDKSLEDCIRELRFAYGKDAHLRNVRQPPGTLSLAAVSPRVAVLFERAFLSENRPEPREWIEALEDLSANLKSCVMHPGHHFYAELQFCPWCEIEAQTGLMLFPFVSGTNHLSDGEAFNIFTVESLVASFDVQQNLPAKIPKPTVLPPLSPEARNTRKEMRNKLIMITALQFFLTGFLVIFFGGCFAFFVSMLLWLICLGMFNTFADPFKNSLEIDLDIAREKLEKIEKEWEKVYAPAELNGNLAQIRKKIKYYQHFPKENHQKAKFLQRARFERELDDYLSSFRLNENQISGIGEKPLSVLRDFGVKTAADIKESRLRSIPGTGDIIAQKLLEWREELEKNFQYVPDVEISKIDQEQIEREVSEIRRETEREIGELLVTIRSGSVKARREQQEVLTKSKSIVKDLAQAERDFAAMALQTPAMILMSVIVFLTLIFGGMLNGFLESPTVYITTNPPSPISFKTSGAASSYSGSANYSVSENITDKEIEEMSYALRQEAAWNIYNETLLITDNKKVEKKLLLAKRLDANNIRILNRLALVIYEQKRYKESLAILEQAAIINSEDFDTKNFIGMNYIMMERYADARKIFTELALTHRSANTVFYNLGLAHKALEDYPSAAKAFRSAVEVSSVDADSRFELGYCLYKTGDTKGARAQYEKLLGINEQRAQDLKKQAKIY